MSSFAQRVRGGVPVLGSFVFLPSPGMVEVLGRSGLDFIIIDQEHSRKSWETVENMVRAAELTGMAALIRVACLEETEILHALETGISGIVLPFVESAKDVQRAGAAMRYAPEGRRGTCTQTRAAGFGARRRGFIDFARQSNQDLLLVGQIESTEGLDHIEDIVGVERGLDVVFLGRSDLASQMGKPGQTDDPEVDDASQKIIDAARRSRKISGLAHYEAQESHRWAGRGCSFFALASETGFLSARLQEFGRQVRQGMAP
jgi:2-keto-3-deoxy-L-rhamnonate aldolase RhmA